MSSQPPTTTTTTTTGGPSAEYLRSRASALTRIMLTAFEDILSVGHDDSPDPDDPETLFDQSLVNTAARQTAVNVATSKIVRAAEEYMVLTRTMKEIWLFGGLDTLVVDEGEEEREKERKTREDERVVVEGMREWAATIGERLRRDVDGGDGGDGKEEGTPMSTG